MHTDDFDLDTDLIFCAPRYPVPLPTELMADALRGELTDGAVVTYAFFITLHDGCAEEIQTHSRAELAEKRGVSIRTLRRHLNALKKCGWLTYGDQGVLTILHKRRAA